MTTPIKRIGVLTGGGDAPGLNAVIRAVTQGAILGHGWEVMGIEDGFLGLIEDRLRPLEIAEVFRIVSAGGTILGTSNKANPEKFATGTGPDGKPVFSDVTDRCLATIKRHRLDALVLIGGDGTMAGSRGLTRSGVKVVGVPKTIDNDIVGTELTFGFLTAVDIAAEAMERVHTTAQSHGRIIAVEVMGRNAGWLALHSGVAAAADVILLPEIPFDLAKITAFLKQRQQIGQRAFVISVSEGARPKGGEVSVSRVDPSSPDPIRLGGVSKYVADELEKRTGIESRYTILGHVQRGGAPIAADRVLATRLGHHAVTVLASGASGRMVVADKGRITDTAIDRAAAGEQRKVPLDHELLKCARAMGICFGD